MDVVVVTRSSILLAVSPQKYKAKSVPTFTLPPKGVIMRTIVQKGCTTVTMLHQNSALM